MGYCSAPTSLLCAWCAHYLSISIIVVSFSLCIERREGTTLESAHFISYMRGFPDEVASFFIMAFYNNDDVIIT